MVGYGKFHDSNLEKKETAPIEYKHCVIERYQDEAQIICYEECDYGKNST